MPSGWCKECDQLVPIHAVSLQMDGRSADWEPVPHERATHVTRVDGGTCALHVQVPAVFTMKWPCRCGERVDPTSLVIGPCPGVNKKL